MRWLSFLLVLLPLAGRAQTASPAAAADAAPALAAASAAPATVGTAEKTALRQANDLLLNRRYESAWKVLQAADPHNAVIPLVLKKVELALNYSVNTDDLRHFAFRDLKLLDPSPDSLRQLGKGPLRYTFPVRHLLDSLHRIHSANYKLDRALGDYYFTVQQCDCAEPSLGEDEVFRRTISHYQQAHDHGQGDYLSYFALGYAYQRLGKFQEAVAPFQRSIQLRGNYPAAHLNLAFVYLELKAYEQAQLHARRAQELFPDAHHKEDAGFLLSQIEARLRTTHEEARPQG